MISIEGYIELRKKEEKERERKKGDTMGRRERA